MTTDIRIGHVIDRLREMPDRSVHMVWSSPPYYGLRSYDTEPQVWGGNTRCQHEWGGEIPHRGPAASQGRTGCRVDRRNNHRTDPRDRARGAFCEHCGAWRGEHGLEPTVAMWMDNEVAIWREVRRVLRDDGTLWLNVGDTYATTSNGRPAAQVEDDDRSFADKPFSTVQGLYKPKDRMMLPARLAIALQEDGWFLRDEIVWAKDNPMPSSVKGRTTPAHEMIYVFAKRRRYFFDAYAIMEPVSGGTHPRRKDGQTVKAIDGGAGFDRRVGSLVYDNEPRDQRNKRSVWQLPIEPFPGAHFATAPTAIVRPCILAGTSARGVCPGCGTPYERMLKTSPMVVDRSSYSEATGSRTHLGGTMVSPPLAQTIGWRKVCRCDAAEPVPATVLDPFGGAGTTGLVADELGRNAILIELNPDYARIARDRIRESLGRVRSDIPEDRGDDLPLLAAAGQ